MKAMPSEEMIKDEIQRRFFSKSIYKIEKDKIDFAVCDKAGNYLFWAEAKKFHDVSKWLMLAQLILTIKPILDKGDILSPSFVGCFDASVITFIEFRHIEEVLIASDFNWKEKPSAVSPKTEKIVERILGGKEHSFNWKDDADGVKTFIDDNLWYKPLIKGDGVFAVQIDKNNFVRIYGRWREQVLPSISIPKVFYTKGIIDGDFFLADLLSENNKTISDKLKVLLHYDQYQIQDIAIKKAIGSPNIALIHFKDNGEAHKHFWEYYKRPPKAEYQDYIMTRRDLLAPSNIRERKGDFFTPQIWVEKSQEYLAKVFGEDWQEDYYIWDCCAGTGNLEEGLSNPQNIWVSTDQGGQVGIMKANKRLFQNHIFQFDFLNDDFDKLPQGLKDIIADPKKQEKLIIYINPPYAENGAGGGKGASKAGVASNNATYEKFLYLGRMSRELFAQFMVRIHTEIQFGKLAQFSKLKYVNAPNFVKFRQFFKAKFKAGFVVPANTFDNVKGQFPIGFLIWDMADKRTIKNVKCDVIEKDGKKIGVKYFYSMGESQKYINDWILESHIEHGEIGNLFYNSNDFQHQNYTYISYEEFVKSISKFPINKGNCIKACIYFAVRLCIPASWLNDRDQFLYPNDKWKKDKKFQNDCLAFTLFHAQNRIKSVSDVIPAKSPSVIPAKAGIPVNSKDVPSSLKEENFLPYFAGSSRSAKTPGVIPAKAGIPVNSNAVPPSLSVEANNEKRNSVKMDACGRRHDSVGSRIRANDSGAETSAGDGGTTVVNHWIPFKAAQVGACESFVSNFMSDFIKTRGDFSAEAKEVFDAGKKLWTYYQKDIYNKESENVNASLYEIREYFRGRTEAGRMKSFSDNEDFQKLDDALKSALAILADKIAEKVYEYEFLRK